MPDIFSLVMRAGSLVIDHYQQKNKKAEVQQEPTWEPTWAPPALDIPPIPQVPAPPYLRQSPAAATQSDPAEADATPSESYAAEIPNTAVACLPCTRGHVFTAGVAADRALESDDPRRDLAVIAREYLAMVQYDWTPAKLAAARPEDRAIIERIRGRVLALTAGMPMAPKPLVSAWGATGEAQRFARSTKQLDQNRAEAMLRMRDVEGWINYTERVDLADTPEAEAYLGAIRNARHLYVENGLDPDTLRSLHSALGAAAVALTPLPDRGTLERVCGEASAINRELHSGIMTKLVPPALRADDFTIRDKNAKLPAQLRQAFKLLPESAKVGPFDNQTTAAYFDQVLKLDQAIGVTVRDRNLPSTFEGVIEGAYAPATNVLLLSPQTESKDNYALQTLVHENAHALLHRPGCQIHHGSYDYEDSPIEQEADLTTLAVFGALHLPLEMADGTVDHGKWQVDWDKLKRQIPPTMFERIQWASQILTEACQGETANAATAAESCPMGTHDGYPPAARSQAPAIRPGMLT